MRLPSSYRSSIGAIAALLLVSACRDDLLTRPAAAPLEPGAPALTITGAVGTPIFPAVAPDDQFGGDARGLNQRGQVTGARLRVSAADDHYKPYRWVPGSAAVQLVGCCEYQWGNDINDAGTVVGQVWLTGPTAHGFVATGTSITPLPILPGADTDRVSGALAINNRGQIAGTSPDRAGAQHAVVWSASLVPRDLGTLGGTFSTAVDINDAGQVIGYSDLPGGATSHAFLWSEQVGMIDLNIGFNRRVASVVEINASGQITGSYFNLRAEKHAFLYTPFSGFRDLGTLGGDESEPTGLNDRGDVVGSSTIADGTTHAFLWTAADGMEDITALTGFSAVGRLNDEHQTLTGFDAPSITPNFRLTQPRLVQLQVTHAPVARFTYDCRDHAHPHQCRFDASTSTADAEIVSYAWDWGNGRHETKKKPIVRNTWPRGGSHLVTLTVTDAKARTNSTTQTVLVP